MASESADSLEIENLVPGRLVGGVHARSQTSSTRTSGCNERFTGQVLPALTSFLKSSSPHGDETRKRATSLAMRREGSGVMCFSISNVTPVSGIPLLVA